MFHPLRALDARTAATDAAMRAAGFQVERAGRWGRAYRLDPAVLAERRAAVERERIAAMGRAVVEMHAIAFPQAHAELQQRRAAVGAHVPPALPVPVAPPVPAVSLDQLAVLLAARVADPDRVVFERLTVQRHPGTHPRPTPAVPELPATSPNP